MKTKKEVIEYCLKTYPDSYLDYPFDEGWAVLRHNYNKKIFVFIFVRNGYTALNLKCEPLKAEFLREVFCSVTPAYHMNKTHWNTVYLDGEIGDEDVFSMIGESYSLTSPRTKK